MRVYYEANAIALLPILPGHLERLRSLPLHHKDPFDRLIIAQAVVEGMTLVGRDSAFAAYGIPLLWDGGTADCQPGPPEYVLDHRVMLGTDSRKSSLMLQREQISRTASADRVRTLPAH